MEPLKVALLILEDFKTIFAPKVLLSGMLVGAMWQTKGPRGKYTLGKESAMGLLTVSLLGALNLLVLIVNAHKGSRACGFFQTWLTGEPDLKQNPKRFVH